MGQGINLPSSSKYTVKIMVGGIQELETGKSRLDNSKKVNYDRWNHRFQYEKPFSLPYKKRRAFDQVIITLMDGTNPICYYKEHISKFRNPNSEWHWVQMIPDPVVGKVTDPNKAGIISFKLYVSKAN